MGDMKLVQHSTLRKYRALDVSEIEDILLFCPRRIKEQCSVLKKRLKSSLVMEELKAGEGKIIVNMHSKMEGHAVSLFRARDKYLYYDSMGRKMEKSVAKYLKKIGVLEGDIIDMRTKLQSRMYGSCAYHALAFLDFAVLSDEVKAGQIEEAFLREFQRDADLLVVKSVVQMVKDMRPVHPLSLVCTDPEESIYNGKWIEEGGEPFGSTAVVKRQKNKSEGRRY